MKISIITATWNSGATIQDTIDSVLRQIEVCNPYGIEVEHIIKDGGSADDTINIIKQNEARYHENLRWVSEKDRGIYDAMNKGIELSTGDIIGILNSDDFYTSDDVILTVANIFDSDTTLDAIYGDIHFVNPTNLDKCTRYYSSRYFKPGLLRFGFMPAHQSFYCRRNVYEKYGLYDLQFKTSSDFEMMVRLFSKNKIHSKYINKDFVTMREGGESTAGIESRKKVNRDIANSLKKHGIYSNQFFQMLRYVWRISELMYTKIKY
jgi:glycosyltransferase involved in cell wall biosynthesis